MGNFIAYSKYYDLLYKDKDYASESKYVVDLLKEHKAGAKKLLELGCGSGSHAVFLCDIGFEVTGIERSKEMVEAAIQKKIKGFTPVVGDITSFIVEGKFDCAISLFHVISYLNSNENLIKCFNLVNRSLSDNGVFIFDVWYTPAVYTQKPGTRIKRMDNDEIRITRITESSMDTNANRVDVNFEVHIFDKTNQRTEVLNEVHPMRHFSRPEIELLAQKTGFTVLQSEEFLTGNAPSENTWGVCFILQKTNNG